MRQPIDKQKVAESFSRAAATYDKMAIVQRRNAERLAAIIRHHCPDTARLMPFLEIGAGTGTFTDLILQLGITRGTVTDIAPAMVTKLREVYGGFPDIAIECLDGEHLALGTRFGAILSASAFQWFSSIQEPFLSYWHHLEPDGLLAFCMFVDGTFRELHRIVKEVGCRYPGHRLPDENDVLSTVLSSGFIIEHFSIIETPITYPDAYRFLSSLKTIGSTNVGAPISPADLRRVLRQYNETYRGSSGITATFRTLYVLARKIQKTP